MIMAVACHPDAQVRIQEELDELEVVGRDKRYVDSGGS
jgi:hypothetical protein